MFNFCVYFTRCHVDFYRPRTEYDGRLCFYGVCLLTPGGRGYPKVPTLGQILMGVPQGTYPLPPTNVPTPQPGPDRGKGTLRYPPPTRSWWGEYPKVPTPPPPRYLPSPPARSQLEGGGSTPRYLPGVRVGQQFVVWGRGVSTFYGLRVG